MEKFIWTDRVRNEEVLRRVSEERNALHIKKKDYWIGHVLPRNCLLKLIIEGKIEIRIVVKERK